MGKSPASTYLDKTKNSVDEVRQKLKLKQIEARNNFKTSFPKANQLLLDKGMDLEKVRDYSGKLLATTLLTGSLLLAGPTGAKPLPSPIEIQEKINKDTKDNGVPVQKRLIEALRDVVPERARPLSREEEKLLEQTFENTMGVKARATLEGEHLNTTYGYIGAEQHLRRYPGDVNENHNTGSQTVLKEGMAPGLGAWGYFAPSKEKLTPELVETEKWYAVVQTLYLKDWARRQPHLRNWYKYRKVLIVNTLNGNAVVAAIADSGPAAWTGKHFGGSPEVMEYLGGPRYKKGPVILFFVDDPDNKVSLGPVEYNKIDANSLVEVTNI
ncbi:hypothetical protein KW795_01050 [Candidatus Microgenomates bacterium]|nr:hypothetical protein [Candidatus Microgenomates bacterium]